MSKSLSGGCLLIFFRHQDLHPCVVEALREGTSGGEGAEEASLCPADATFSRACHCSGISHTCGGKGQEDELKRCLEVEGDSRGRGIEAREEGAHGNERDRELTKSQPLEASSSSSSWLCRRASQGLEVSNPLAEQEEEDEKMEKDERHSGERRGDEDGRPGKDLQCGQRQVPDEVGDRSRRTGESKDSPWCICRYLRHVQVPSVSPVTPQQQRRWGEVWPCYLNKTKPPPSGDLKGKEGGQGAGGGSGSGDDGRASRRSRRADSSAEGMPRKTPGGSCDQDGDERASSASNSEGFEEREARKEVREDGGDADGGEEKRKEENEDEEKDSRRTAVGCFYGTRQELLTPLQLTPEEKQRHKFYLQAAVRCTVLLVASFHKRR